MLLNGVQDAEEVGGPEFGDVLVTETGFQEADGYVDGVVVSVETPAATAAVKVAGDAYVVYSCYLDECSIKSSRVASAFWGFI